ncbi:hypothetical protein LTR28_004950 [Elasticomyces elasticus]|nr:hypothetical protein LTR28_004950 [Elasticomyces elasticus]
MFLRRAAFGLSRRVELICHRTDASGREGNPDPGESSEIMKPLDEIKSEKDLLPPGGMPGTIPTDLEQSTGIERLEIMGKMQGIDVFDMMPLDTSRKVYEKQTVEFAMEQYEEYVHQMLDNCAQ